MKYFVTGGGTGGHIYPALAICSAIIKNDPESYILFVGTKRKADEEILKNRAEKGKLEISFVRACGLPRGFNPLKLLKFITLTKIGIFQCIALLIKHKPDIIIGTGGYGSFPLFFANLLFGKKTFIHEQNVHPGLANRVLGKLAKKIGVSFRETLKCFPQEKAVFTGYPLRWKELPSNKIEIKKKLGFNENKKIVFVFGGSLGARSINIALTESLPALMEREEIGIIHSAGKNVSAEYNAYEDTLQRLKKKGIEGSIEGKYHLQPYFDNINEVYAASDIVVSRSGAGTVVELASMGIPSILIPKSLVPGNHQYFNAEVLAKNGSAVILKEEVIIEDGKRQEWVKPEKLTEIIFEILFNDKKLREMSESARNLVVQDAGDRIFSEIISLVK